LYLSILDFGVIDGFGIEGSAGILVVTDKVFTSEGFTE
jgi:hypothetical protein